jgi:hypothetical protein
MVLRPRRIPIWGGIERTARPECADSSPGYRGHFDKKETPPKFTPLTSGNIISASEMIRAP